MVTVAPTRRAVFATATPRQTSVLLALAWAVPFVVHLIPWTGERPLGAHLLPAFWTVFAAAYLFGPRIAAVTALVLPVVNLVLTGLPAAAQVGWFAAELVLFAVLAAAGVRRWSRLPLVAPLAYLAARLVVVEIQALVRGQANYAAIGASLAAASAGLVVLALLNLALVRFRPKSA